MKSIGTVAATIFCIATIALIVSAVGQRDYIATNWCTRNGYTYFESAGGITGRVLCYDPKTHLVYRP